MTIAIRPAATADVPAMEKLIDEVDAQHREALPWVFAKPDAPRSEMLDSFVSHADRLALVAERDGTVAGLLLMFVREVGGGVIHPARVADLDILVVGARFRRQGIGRRLVEAATAWAHAANTSRVELAVHEFNDSARAFWESVGFSTMWRRMWQRLD